MGMPVMQGRQRSHGRSQKLTALLLPKHRAAARKLRLLRLIQLRPHGPPVRGWQPALAQQQGLPSPQGCSCA